MSSSSENGISPEAIKKTLKRLGIEKEASL
jgi:hypothetical protein